MAKKYIFMMIMCLLSTFAIAVTATSTAGFSSLGTASAYSYSGTMNEGDQLRILTYIWGQVQKPGLYIVPDDTDLITLISLAGGPTENAKIKQIRIVRAEKDSTSIIYVDMKKYIETGSGTVIPVLKPGDTIIVPGTSFYAFTRVTDFLSKIAIALGVYSTVKTISKG